MYLKLDICINIVVTQTNISAPRDVQFTKMFSNQIPQSCRSFITKQSWYNFIKKNLIKLNFPFPFWNIYRYGYYDQCYRRSEITRS